MYNKKKNNERRKSKIYYKMIGVKIFIYIHKAQK